MSDVFLPLECNTHTAYVIQKLLERQTIYPDVQIYPENQVAAAASPLTFGPSVCVDYVCVFVHTNQCVYDFYCPPALCCNQVSPAAE